MSSHRTLRIVLCCLLVGSLFGAITPAVAAPPPRPLCDACGDSFESTAKSHGVVLTVERSTATVSVHENGSSTWVVRNHLADSESTARLRTNVTLLADVADGAMWDTEFLGANVSPDGVVTMRYREVNFAERSVGGTLRSGAITEAYGYQNLDGLGANRLVVVAPEGTHIGWAVPGATVSDDGRRMTLTRLDEGGFVTFVPHDAALGPLLSVLAVLSLVGPTIVVNAFAYIALPTAMFALLVGAAAGALSWLDLNFERIRNTAGVSLAVGGALVTTFSLLATGGVSLLGGAAAPLFGVGIALVSLGVVFSRPAVRERTTFRVLVAGAAFGMIVAAGSTVAGAVIFDQNGLTLSLLTSLPLLVPVFLLLPAGYALGRENRRLAIGTAAAGFALAMVPLAPFTSPTIGLGFLLVLAVTVSAAIVAVVGTPLLVVGASLATARSVEEPASTSTRE